MNNLIRYYNQNRRKVWWIIIIIAFVLLLIQVLNSFAAMKNRNVVSNQASRNTVVTNTGVTITYSGDNNNNVSQRSVGEHSKIMNSFVTYCNNGNVTEAYNLLSDNCKNQMYEDIQKFQDNYYMYIFKNGNMTYTMNRWTGNTYIVEFKKDLLSTGGSSSGEKFSDYITIVRDNSEYKLNINSYVGKKEINKTTEKNGIAATVISKDMYMEHEIYNIKIKNKTNSDIILDSKNSTTSTYLLDNNNVKYYAYLNEIPDNNLYIKYNYEKDLSIKFSSAYSSERNMKALYFSNLKMINSSNEEINFRVNI